ncbi:hypothetical protein KRX57_00495 [Weeksellaceae bacterium TAE3-ERU29]|nr:hypothetical protein [Weeksellaceae bacterium TAE3-ERU29]
MKKTFTFLVLFCALAIFAQNRVIAIKGPQTDAIATTLQEAVNLAKANDVIYMPDGIYELETLDKPVHIIGTGYNPNVEKATSVTRINTDGKTLKITEAASGSILEGAEFHNIEFTEGKAHDVTMKRILANNIKGYGENGYAKNNTFIEVMVKNRLEYFKNSYVYNSVARFFNNIDNSLIKNCTGSSVNAYYSGGWNYSATYPSYYSMSNTIIENSIGVHTYNLNNCTLVNTHFTNDWNKFKALFKNVTSDTPAYTQDYHFAEDASISGADISKMGIYNGDYPWKENAHPFAPMVKEDNSYLDVQNEQFKIKVRVIPQTR